MTAIQSRTVLLKNDGPVLKGRFVILEPLRQEHTDELWSAAKEEDIWHYMSMKVKTEDDLTHWIEKRREAMTSGTAYAFIQRDAKTRKAFGSTSIFEIDIHNRRAEIGHTWVGASHRRTAANTESKLLLLTYAFEKMNLARVQIKTDPGNVRSQKAIERLGASFEGRARNLLVYEDGSVHDRMIYSVIVEEWPKVKKRLEGFLSPPYPGPKFGSKTLRS